MRQISTIKVNKLLKLKCIPTLYLCGEDGPLASVKGEVYPFLLR